MVWLDLGLKSGLLGHWWTLYPLGDIFIIQVCWQHRFPWLSLSICSYWSLAILINGIQCPHRSNVYKFLLVSQLWCVGVYSKMSIKNLSYFSSRVQYDLLIFLGLQDGRKVAVQLLFCKVLLLPKFVQNAVSLCSSHLVFSPNVFLESKCIWTIVFIFILYSESFSQYVPFGLLQVFHVKLGSPHRTSNQTLHLFHTGRLF